MRRHIIGLAGVAGSGKDTVADYLVRQHGYTKIAFADPLRAMTAALLPYLGIQGDTTHLLQHDRAFKEADLPLIHRSPRHLLQTLGTEWGRNLVRPDMWLRIAEHRVMLTSGPVVITDVRFANEATLVRRMGGRMWCLSRCGAGIPGNHSSEMPLPAVMLDRAITNNGTPEQLFEAADAALADDFALQPQM